MRFSPLCLALSLVVAPAEPAGKNGYVALVQAGAADRPGAILGAALAR